MTMSNSDYLSYCLGELDRSRRWRHTSSNNFDESWKRYSDLYAGKHYDRKNKVDQLTVNMVFSTINTMAPAVAINNPKFAVNARRVESAPQAIITEEVLNYLWRTYGYQRDFRLAIHDWLIIGHGWLKCGYKATKKPVEKKVEGSGTASNSMEGSDDGEGVDDREDVPGNTESEMIQTDSDRPFVERISPFDMFVDPDARHPKEMRWIAQRTWRPVSDVQADSRYSATARKNVTGSSWSRWSTEDGDARNPNDRPQSSSSMYAEVIEFYDIKRDKVSTFVRNGDDPSNRTGSGFLIKPAEMPYAFGHPFVMFRNHEIPDTFYPMGDVQQIESLQLELNETRNQMLNYRKKFRRAWLYAKDAFDRDGVAALQSEDDNVAIGVNVDVAELANAVVPVPAAITPPEFFDQSAMISTDLDRISGVSDYQRGGMQQNIKRTATEAAMIQDSSNARAQDRLAKVEGFLAEAGERIVQLMQQYTTEEQMARVVTMPTRAWFKYGKDHIAGQFDYEVVGGSTEPQNETFRRQAAMQTVDLSMPFIDAGIVNMEALYMKLLRDGMGVKDAERFIVQPQQGPPQGAPPSAEGMGAAPPPPGAGPQGMGGGPPGMAPGAPPMPPQELTPDDFAAMAMQQGAAPPPPDQGVPPEVLAALTQGGM